MLAVNVQPNVKAAVRKLGQINGDIDKASYRAVNYSLRSSRTYTTKRLALFIGARKQKTIRETIKVVSANGTSFAGALIGFGRPIPADKIKGTRWLKGQNAVRMTSAGKTRHISNAWKDEGKNKNSYRRKKPGELPKGITAMSVPNGMMRIMKSIKGVMREAFEKEFLRLINVAIKR
jgi:hypothetical protein